MHLSLGLVARFVWCQLCTSCPTTTSRLLFTHTHYHSQHTVSTFQTPTVHLEARWSSVDVSWIGTGPSVHPPVMSANLFWFLFPDHITSSWSCELCIVYSYSVLNADTFCLPDGLQVSSRSIVPSVHRSVPCGTIRWVWCITF